MKRNLKQKLSATALALLTVASLSGSAFADGIQGKELSTSEVQSEELSIEMVQDEDSSIENPKVRSAYNSTMSMSENSTLTGKARSYTAGNQSLSITVTATDQAIPTKFKATLQKSSLGGYSYVSSQTYSISKGNNSQKYFGSQSAGTYRYFFDNRSSAIGSTKYSQGFSAKTTMRS